MLSYYLFLVAFTEIVTGTRAGDKARYLSSEFSEARLTSQSCEDEWFMCELQSSGW